MQIGNYLPPIGLEIPLSMYTFGTEIEVNVLGTFTLAFKGGITLRVEGNIGSGLGGITLKVIGFEMSADSEKFGKVTISQADTDTTPLSMLEVIDNSGNSPTFRVTVILDFQIRFEKPPADVGPLLSNMEPATLIEARTMTFPPQGSSLVLQAPIFLARTAKPDTCVGGWKNLKFTWSHNP